MVTQTASLPGPPVPPRPAVLDPQLDTIRVLIVEDQAMFAEALSRLIDQEADLQSVGTVSSVRAALESVRRDVPDVVLMDYALPDGDGVAAAREIRRSSPDTEVIMLTGFAEPSVLVAAIEAGCCGFITKNQAAREVVHGVRRAHEGEAVIEPGMLAGLLPRLHRCGFAPRSQLTRRELEVLRLLARGTSNREIAEQMVLSVNTIRCHVHNLMMKLGAHSKLEAVSKAIRQGIIPPL
jgi:DNA-binding NarL/FixJ family response regulator